ncbi:diacylglycerol/lipid kinase family protein [Micromonospora endolithica]|uniref:Diacylglycerol kinase n=1 Tax=Micromonospora endolithica TaxID=230091 RepID=A0A3A9ZHQ7_9ACTN|nr:diacylglycerol kinase family protein [Micromonospora endolithica]RKN47655.1 diacylglycerol kinase [Micromonospora endolithica]TWJ21323.1 YegS/Rv2252/BmrU family lipid kinase [Micromonospora endolithica]
MRTFAVILGPAARRGLSRLMPVAHHLRAAGARIRVEYTQTTEQARRCATEAVDAGEVVVAAGGDGTIRLLAAAVVDAGGTLGVIPAGRGNDLARELRLPHSPTEVADLLLHGRPRQLDVLRVAGQTVIGSVYVGVDAAANELANRSRLPASLVYPSTGLRALLRWPRTRYTITLDGRTERVHAYTVVAANCGYYGNGLHVAPGARPDDGTLEVVVVRHASRLLFPVALWRMRTGSHVGLRQVTAYRTGSVTVRADRPVVVYGDGDPVGQTAEVKVEVRPGALRIIAG